MTRATLQYKNAPSHTHEKAVAHGTGIKSSSGNEAQANLKCKSAVQGCIPTKPLPGPPSPKKEECGQPGVDSLGLNCYSGFYVSLKPVDTLLCYIVLLEAEHKDPLILKMMIQPKLYNKKH